MLAKALVVGLLENFLLSVKRVLNIFIEPNRLKDVLGKKNDKIQIRQAQKLAREKKNRGTIFASSFSLYCSREMYIEKK